MVRCFRYGVYTLLLIGISIPSVRAADDHAGEKGKTAAETSGAAAVPGDKLSPKELEQIVKGFGTNDEFVKDRWDTKLPAALEAARNDKKEEDIATIFTKLVGMVNDTQMKAMGEQANKEAATLETGANRYAELLKHMVWTKEIFFPSEKKDDLKFKPEGLEFESFKKLLVEKWNEQSKKNQNFYDLLKDAGGDDKDKKDKAIAELRTKYDPKALIPFIDAQAKSGNKELADKLGSALAFGNHIDAVNQAGDKVRINFTKEGGLSAALAEYSQKSNKPVSGLTFSPTEHDTPGITFTPGKDIETNASAKKIGEAPAGGGNKETTGGNTGGGGEKKADTGKKPEVDMTTAKGSIGAASLTDNCASCHSAPSFKGGFNLTEFISNPTKAKLKEIFDAVDGGGMPKARPGQKLDPNVVAKIKADITAWAKEAGAN